MNPIKIPLATPSLDGDKECKCCGTLYESKEFYELGLLAYGLHYLNCVNCKSTLTKKELAIENVN